MTTHRTASVPRLRTSLAVVCAAACLFAVPPAPAAGGSPDDTSLVVTVAVPDRATADLLEARLDVLDLDPRTGTATILVDGEELAWLRSLGLGPAVDSKQSAALDAELVGLPGQTEGIPGFPCYRSVDDIATDAALLAAAHPSVVEIVDVGDSWLETQVPGTGYDVLMIRLTNRSIAGPKPVMMVTGGIHGREIAGTEVVMRMAERLAAGYDVDPDVTWLLDHHEIQIIPMVNPDGRKMVENGMTFWRKNVDSADHAICAPDEYGVDVNRNFPFEWACCGGGSSLPCSPRYYGAAPESEPETQAVTAVARAAFPDQRPDDLVTPAPLSSEGVLVDIQSFGRTIFTPWGFTTVPPPNATGILALGDRIAAANQYDVVPGSAATVDGAIKDFAYGELGVPSYTIEVGTTFLQSCPTFEAGIWQPNQELAIYPAKAARAPYVLSYGPVVLEVTSPKPVVAPGELLQVDATADDGWLGPNPTQTASTVAAAEVTVDDPPWSGSAVPVAMSAVDGVFDEIAEDVTALIDTTGLTQGRHTAYVRARDANADWGVPTALFFWVLDPASAAHVAGTVRSSADLSPVAASVAVGPFEDTSSAVTGAFDLVVEDGTYTASFRADGFAPKNVTGVTASAPATTTVDVTLDPLEIEFEDDVESGNQGWLADATWAITTEDANSPTHSWTDSPGGDYANDTDSSLTSPVFDLTGLYGTRVEFFHRYALQDGWDSGTVEVSVDGGTTWTGVAWYTGVQATWQQVVLELPQLDGESQVRLRFRLQSDVDGTADGWYVDDITVSAATPVDTGAIFSDGFESGDASAWSASVP